MSDLKQLVRELATYALSKRGAEPSPQASINSILEEPKIELQRACGWGEFFELDEIGEFDREPKFPVGTQYFHMPVLKEALARHRERFPEICESSWLERDGHVYLDVPVDAEIPIAFLKTLIDDAHAIVLNKVDAHGHFLLDLADLPYDERAFIDRLIEHHNMVPFREAIHSLARPAILLVTRMSEEDEIPFGATKIGGRPDLPPTVEWPVYRNGRPLAFLCQLNLAELSALPPTIENLPKHGVLSVFSCWGWVTEDSLDPQTPDDRSWDTQQGWTVVVQFPSDSQLERREPDDGLYCFQAAAVTPVSILSLPNGSEEPPLAALGWDEVTLNRFDELQSDFRSLQMGHWLKQSYCLMSHHFLGGYALFQQEFPSDLLTRGVSMFLQIGTDENTGMCWGDGGELTFYADSDAMKRGRIERVWCEFQCG